MHRHVIILASLAVILPLAATASAGEVQSPVDLRFWGRAVFNVHYDTSLQGQEFISYLVEEGTDELNFNPREARLGFAASQTSGDWTYRAVVSFDFYGDSASNNLLPRLRLGYAEARSTGGWTIRGGQDWVPVAGLLPGTLDFGSLSWAGNLWQRVPQLTVRRQVGDVELLAGALKHRISNAQEQQEIMPWLIGRIAASDRLGAGSLLALGGGYRSVTVDGADYQPWLVAAELVLPLGATGASLTAEAYVGAGIGRTWVHYGFDYNPQHPGGATTIASRGGFASLRVPVAARVEANAGFGVDDPDDADLAVASRSGEPSTPAVFPAYLRNAVVFGNAKVHVTEHFGWGVEVAHLMTERSDGDELTGQRFTTSLWFKF